MNHQSTATILPAIDNLVKREEHQLNVVQHHMTIHPTPTVVGNNSIRQLPCKYQHDCCGERTTATTTYLSKLLTVSKAASSTVRRISSFYINRIDIHIHASAA